MASKRDQLQSHQFLVQRMVSALVMRETDPEHPPFRRARLAGFGSVVLAVIALGVALVYGLVVPGGKRVWQSGDVMIVEKETGTRYVYLDGRLHPATNYASALLAIGRKARTVQVSRNSLAGVPRGPRIGIADAPDALPDRKRLLNGGWTMCSEPTVDEAGTPTSEAVLMVGDRPSGGRVVGDAAMLVEVSGGDEQYLVWRGYRHRVEGSDAEAVELALGEQPWAEVSATFIDVLPAAEPVAPIEQRNIGQQSRAIPSRSEARVGQLFMVETAGGGTQYYLAEATALRPISALQYDIQRSTRAVTKAYGGKAPYAIALDPATVGGASRLPEDKTVEASALPRSRPDFAAPRNAEGAVCAMYAPGESSPELMVDPAMPTPDPMTVTSGSSGTKTALADRVIVPPGRAVVVEALASETTPRGTVSVVTDMGRAYPLADPQLLEVLGYGGVAPVKMPAWLVARIPQGSGLATDAALHQP
ncbi:type VII secretion protein EccB [Actinomycetes bacterium KLBMP 9797]